MKCDERDMETESNRRRLIGEMHPNHSSASR